MLKQIPNARVAIIISGVMQKRVFGSRMVFLSSVVMYLSKMKKL